MKLYKYILLLPLTILLSCEIDEIPDPNNPNATNIQENASLSELQLLATGIESEMRDEVGFYYDVLGIIGREYYFFTGSDPRYTGELLGKGASTLDDAGFYGTRPYAGRYKVVKNANILLAAIENTTTPLTDQEVNGFTGYAKTMKAYSFLLVLNMQYQNGIRMDVADPENLGSFIDYNSALQSISDLLDEAYTELNNAGSEATFSLSSAFPIGLESTIETVSLFNRGIKARVEIYRNNKTEALNALNDSFFDLGGSLDMGSYHFYSKAGTDLTNPVFRTRNESEALIAHPSYITDIRPGDQRIEKVALRDATAVNDDLSGDYDVNIYPSNDSYIPIIRNEELILIYAEANIGSSGNVDAINALNVIRNAHGLGVYTGLTTDAAVTDELLYNRRYSLFGEAHRWIDMRRFDRLDQLPIDRADDDVWEQLPRPVSELGVQGG